MKSTRNGKYLDKYRKLFSYSISLDNDLQFKLKIITMHCGFMPYVEFVAKFIKTIAKRTGGVYGSVLL